jgi:hypothetical protein
VGHYSFLTLSKNNVHSLFAYDICSKSWGGCELTCKVDVILMLLEMRPSAVNILDVLGDQM